METLYSWTALTFDIKFIVHAVNYIDLEDDLKDEWFDSTINV